MTAKKSKRIKPRYQAAFILLSLETLVLLAIGLRFFTHPLVWSQLYAWSSQSSPGSLVLNLARLALPETAPFPSSVVIQDPAPLPTPTPPVVLAAAQPVVDPVPEPAQTGPTPEPVVRVLEELPPQGHLVIPSLDIDQPLTPLVVREQAWDLASLGSQVGWLETTGTHPGDNLAMVFIGHITLPYPGGAGPFLYLADLEIGDAVEYRVGQERYVYQITRRSIVAPNQIDSLYLPDGNTLLLVTCTGYNGLEMEYDLRLLIAAELVAVQE